MGDLVAVMQVGGHLEQFASPADILAAPASEFVARFVGADRGLKRLSLSRVADLELRPTTTARVGDDAAEARRRAIADPFAHLLLVDEQNRPLGWIGHDEIPTDGRLTESMAESMSPLVNRRTTLKDALSMLLDADVQAGIVVDRNGAVLGLVTADMIAERMRETAGDVRFASIDLESITQADPLSEPEPVEPEPAEPAAT
jgi:osmoprotectant transport system ATP-binding protein